MLYQGLKGPEEEVVDRTQLSCDPWLVCREGCLIAAGEQKNAASTKPLRSREGAVGEISQPLSFYQGASCSLHPTQSKGTLDAFYIRLSPGACSREKRGRVGLERSMKTIQYRGYGMTDLSLVFLPLSSLLV